MKLLHRNRRQVGTDSDEYYAERPLPDEAPEPQPEREEPRLREHPRSVRGSRHGSSEGTGTLASPIKGLIGFDFETGSRSCDRSCSDS